LNFNIFLFITECLIVLQSKFPSLFNTLVEGTIYLLTFIVWGKDDRNRRRQPSNDRHSEGPPRWVFIFKIYLFLILLLLWLLSLTVLWVKIRGLHMLGKHFTIELHSQPLFFGNRDILHSPGWPWTRSPLASASWVLEL
jgi:hypothetical protein